MSIEILGIVIFVALFVTATVTPVNMGLLALVAAYVFGVFAGGMNPKDVAKAMPADLFVTLVGVTYLFQAAQTNGAIGRMIGAATRAVGGRKALLPWMMFLLAGTLTAIGALSPAAVAILAPLAMSYARRNGLSPLTTGLVVVHGAQAGGFSPLSVYGGIVRDAAEKGGLTFDALAPFFASAAMNTLAALALYLVVGRLGRRDVEAGAQVAEASEDPPGSVLSTGLTLAALAALAIATLVFKLEIGFVAIGLGLLLSFMAMKTQRAVLQRLPWSEIVLILGVSTYVAVLQQLGVVDYASDQVAQVGSLAAAALLVLYIAAVVSAFASSTAVLGSLIPLAVPLLQNQPPLVVATFISALAVAATIVDVSPFSTNGALVLASAGEQDRQRLFRQLMTYGAVVTVVAPLLLWAIFLAVR